VALIGLGVAFGILCYSYVADTRTIEEKKASLVRRIFGDKAPVKNLLSGEFRDKDGDLIADAPTNEAEWVDPEILKFSYVAGKDSKEQGQVWQSLLEALAEKTGKKVDYIVFEKQDEQLAALKEAQLHVCGLNTGAVPIAVNAAGFVPVSMLSRADGSSGYTMKLIVPAASPIKSVADLKGSRIHFLWRDSNSGFKAPVVILRDDFGLHPYVDYDFGFLTSHEDSIRAISRGEIKAAPVASDMIDRLVAREQIDRSTIREIYTSERFPPAALGYVSTLHPDLASKIRAILIDLSFTGTSMEKEFAPSGVDRLRPTSYKDDFAIVRRIDDALGSTHEIRKTSLADVKR
jgi:phosphonate transport system substrate-binding protein